jgi:hypothetical protein
MPKDSRHFPDYQGIWESMVSITNQQPNPSSLPTRPSFKPVRTAITIAVIAGSRFGKLTSFPAPSSLRLQWRRSARTSALLKHECQTACCFHKLSYGHCDSER